MPSASPNLKQTKAKQLTNKVAILDCGAQYTKVIDRRIRELNVCSDLLPLNVDPEALKNYGAIILSGGPNSVTANNAPEFNEKVLQLGLPVLGICYGMQLIAHHLGGKVSSGEIKEYGETRIQVNTQSTLFQGLSSDEMVLMSHGDKVLNLPEGFTQIGSSGDIVAAIGNPQRRIYGVQFHPEVELTLNGTQILKNFLYDVAGLKGDYSLESRLDETLSNIQNQVKDNPVFVLVSGGVDSAVTAAMLLKALKPEQIYALHVDTGFMRYQESDGVCQSLESLGLMHLEHLKAEETFLNATAKIDGKTVGPLSQVTDPEVKRRIIGDMFFELTQRAMEKLNLDLDKTFIAQGTLRPDLIESGNVGVSKIAHKIKTHHNVVPVIQAQREKGLIVEPNQDLHKDEVRKIGLLLGLPDEIVQRQPFPGPGLAIRVICSDAPYLTNNFESLNQQVASKAAGQNLHGCVLPIKSVGVQGDFRSYSYLTALSGAYQREWEGLKELATQIPNTVGGINRVGLLLEHGRQLPGQVTSITPTTLNHESLELIRQIDHLVIGTFKKEGFLGNISQLLTVLIPIDTKDQGRHSIAIRGVVTSDYMTARPAILGEEIPWSLIEGLDQTIRSDFPIDCVFYDLTGKPPATVEWE